MPKPRSPGLVNAYGLKKATGSWSALAVPAQTWGAVFAINALMFQPRLSTQDITQKCRFACRTNSSALIFEGCMYNEAPVAAADLACDWTYIAATKPPETWVEVDEHGTIVQLWRSEREGPGPPITAMRAKGRIMRLAGEGAEKLKPGDKHGDTRKP